MLVDENQEPKANNKIEDVGKKFDGAKKDLGLSAPTFDQSKNIDPDSTTRSQVWPKPNFRQDARNGDVPPKHALIFMLVYEWISIRHIGGHLTGNGVTKKQWNDAYIRIVSFYRERYELGLYEDIDDLKADFNTFLEETFTYGTNAHERHAASKVVGRYIYSCCNLNVNRRLRYNSLLALGWIEHDVISDQDSYGVCELRNSRTKQVYWSVVQSNTPKSVETLSDKEKYQTMDDAIVGLKEYFRPILEQRIVEAQLKAEQDDGSSDRKKPFRRPRFDRDAIRIGKDYRDGQSVSIDKFNETFNFLGIEWGNYVTQNERQLYLDRIFDAFNDMCSLFGLPSTFASLGGRLGLAVGSRGNNRASAHFDLSRWLMHFVKTKSVGAFSHEFGHALDAYLAKRNNITHSYNGMNYRFATDFFFHRCRSHPSSDENCDFFRDAPKEFINLMRCIKFNEYGGKSGFYKNAMILDQNRSSDYWSQPTELFARAFESWCEDSLIKRGHINEFLVYGTRASSQEWNTDVSAYPSGDDRQRINEAMSEWVRVVVQIWKG
ncbi:LPD1 domain-containing protein [Acinetobacter sp. P1(2025)]|uniref:LPD1 domain-containing protein n=1 Tax=Acinetobacter sp. P1(2025) TaxID=3446120 RepID=UPI003F536326